jgi:hypothetical protein
MGCLAVNVFWNEITWAGVWAQLNRGINPQPPGWKGWLFLTRFMVIGVGGLALLMMSLLQAISDARAGATIVEVSMNPLEPGKRCKVVFWSPRQFTLTALVVRLVCEEEVRYGTGEDAKRKSKRVRELDVYRGDGLHPVVGPPFETTFEFEVPADLMHSFEVENYRIRWHLKVIGEPDGRPTFDRQFAIVVNPARSSGAAS